MLKVKYFVARIGKTYGAWSESKCQFIEAGLRLYRAEYDDYDEALNVLNVLREAAPDDPIYLDSFLAWEEE